MRESAKSARESAALAEAQMRASRDQLDLLREGLVLTRNQLDAFKEYQEEVLAAPDFAIKLEVPFVRGAQIVRGRWPTVSEILVNYGLSTVCVVTVENIGRVSARNAVVTLGARRELELGATPPWASEEPSRDPQLRLLRYQSKAIYPKNKMTLPFPVSIKSETPDGGPQIIVWIEADNLTRQYEHVFVFRKRKSK